jgi:hypothetical protein
MHLRQSGPAYGQNYAGIYTDNAGTPDRIVAHAAMGPVYLSNGTSTAGRWLQVPMGVYLPAGDYWIAMLAVDAQHDIAVDTSGGTDRTYVTNATGQADWGFFAPTTTAKDYSIRASLLS